MRLDRTNELLKTCAEQMNARYKGVVFDEWAIVSLADGKGRLLSYLGPRKQVFQKSFLADVGAFQEGLIHVDYAVGDFEFAREGAGAVFAAFMVVGRGLYLVCNNTVQRMDAITQAPLWLGAQVPFVDLSEMFRANPLAVASCQSDFRVRV
jgi:hypothetical protein